MRMMDGPDDFIGPVNLGNPDEFTILELANLVIELTGSRSKVVHKDLPVDDPTRRRPDITLAKEKARLAAQDEAARRAGENDCLVQDVAVGRVPGADAQLLSFCRARGKSSAQPHESQ